MGGDIRMFIEHKALNTDMWVADENHTIFYCEFDEFAEGLSNYVISLHAAIQNASAYFL